MTGTRIIAGIATIRGLPPSRYVASRFMKEQGLGGCQLPSHKFKKATPEHVAIPNTLERQFAVTKPDQVWGADIMFHSAQGSTYTSINYRNCCGVIRLCKV